MSRYKGVQPRLSIVSLYWSLWISGTILLVLGWFRLVHPLVAWAGFFIASAATIVSIIFNLTVGRQRHRVPVAGSTRPATVAYDEDSIQIGLIDGRVISAPLAWYPKLEKATEDERARYEIDGNGLCWPELDVDVSVLDVLDGVQPVHH